MITYLICLIVLFLLEMAYFKIAVRFDIVDRPNLRSSHSSVTLRGGGIVFLFGVWLYTAVFGCTYPWFLGGVCLVGIVSFADDVHPLPYLLRLGVQFVAVAAMSVQFVPCTDMAWWLALIWLVVGVGFINAYNFMDGINGITGAYSFAVLVPLVYLDRSLRFIDMPLLYLAALSLLVFCFYNFRKRERCFAGDVGSISMAFILLFAIARLVAATGDYSYFLFAGVYGVDAVLTICHRIMLHENIAHSHRKHAYQLMANELHVPHLLVAGLYAALQLALSAGLLFLNGFHYLYAGCAVTALSVAYIVFMRRYYHLHNEMQA